MRGDSFEGALANEQARVAQKARELKPTDLPDAAADEWDLVAPILAASHLDRLKPHYVPAIVEMCHLLARIKGIRTAYPELNDEMYEVDGRNGKQWKMHPVVAQLNDAQRQLRSYFSAFGMTPADERNLAPGQANLFDPAAKFLD